ncbi:hypothetical protein DID77_04330, partial [Candidatus Marinamargulisbacteria bacterium SCGC AG-439-L15]
LFKAVSKKQLMASFEEYPTHDVIGSISRNANALTSLFKNYDQMKSNRISKEVSTLKLIMNSLKEGIILINVDKIVTHINHEAEAMLGLIPGEIIGQVIHRNISNEAIIQSLDDVLEKEHKVVNKKVSIREGEQAFLTLLPVKNRSGEFVRALLILTRQSNEPSLEGV